MSNYSRRDFIRQGLCATIGTAGMTNAIADLRLMNAAIGQTASSISDYKALICVFLQGGNDSNNLFIPTIAEEYANYAAIRTPVLALPAMDGSPSTILGLNNLTQDGHNYGIHPACPELQSLFNNGKMAAVFNVGNLVYPVTKAQYTAKSVALPPQLFSHADQALQWQTSIPDAPATSGWGGRCADLLDTYNPHSSGTSALSMCISLAGSNTFEVGGTVQQFGVTSSGVVSLTTTQGPATARTPSQKALMDLLGIDAQQQHLLTQNYSLALQHALATGAGLSTALTATKMAPYWTAFPKTVAVPNTTTTFNSSLLAQMKMVAQIIEAGYRSTAQGGLGMKRQIFFVQVGGYDLHTGQTANSGKTTVNNPAVISGAQANLFAELSQSLNALQSAMVAIGAQYSDPQFDQRVTSFTSSDFGRTLACNFQGSDHGWGSHHIVVGGAVKGQRTYGNFPALVIGGPDDTSTGRWIPTSAVDQFAATLATWFGVDGSNINTVFPNLDHFSTPDLGFMNPTTTG